MTTPQLLTTCCGAFLLLFILNLIMWIAAMRSAKEDPEER